MGFCRWFFCCAERPPPCHSVLVIFFQTPVPACSPGCVGGRAVELGASASVVKSGSVVQAVAHGDCDTGGNGSPRLRVYVVIWVISTCAVGAPRWEWWACRWLEHCRHAKYPQCLLLPPYPAQSTLIPRSPVVCSPSQDCCSPPPAAKLPGIVSGLLCLGARVHWSRNATNELYGCGVQARTHVQAFSPLPQHTKRSTIACIRDNLGVCR